MHSISGVWPHTESPIHGERPKASCLKYALNGRIWPNFVHEVGERWTVYGQSGAATPLPRKLEMTSSE